MPLPTRDEIFQLLAEHPRGVEVEHVLDALGLSRSSRGAVLRLLDNWVYEGLLLARDSERFALLKPHSVAPAGAPATPPVARTSPARERADTANDRPMPGFTVQRPAKEPKLHAQPKTRTKAERDRAPREVERVLSSRPSQPQAKAKVAHKSVNAARTTDWRGVEKAPLPVAQDAAPGRRGERTGTLTVNPRGFGFVASPAHVGDDVFVHEGGLGNAMHGDAVIVRITGRSSRGVEGEILEVVGRGKNRVGGILRRRGKSAWVEADDNRVRRPVVLSGIDTRGSEGNSGDDGDAVVVEITRFPESPDENPEGRILAVLGRPGELATEVQKTLLVAGIDELHSAEATAEAESYGETVPKAMLQGRVDLTHVPLPTIDPEDARDHDDAVWVERTKRGGFKAHIAIADVSSYVTPNTKLDEEARMRGCSVYLPERAIPMLPRALSSNLCSLLPDEVRLCLCVIAELDAGGTVLDYQIVRGFMKSRAKLTYGGVARALGFTEEPPRDPVADSMRADLEVANELSRLLRGRRQKRGALDFELPEPKVVFDEDKNPVDVQARGTDPGMKKAYQLIEELMLLANELVAQFLVERELPGIFRVHLAPDETKLERLAAMCDLLGVEFDAEEAQNPKKLGKMLRRFAEHEHKSVLHGLLLRSMKQAAYDVENLGHFGLASKAYLHFTSPIRRYPDLVVHRVIHDVLLKKRIDRSDEGRQKMAEAAALASGAERRAMEAEREVLDLYRCTVMRERIGEVHPGTVTAIVGTGLFVALKDPFVDVLVRFEDLGREAFSADEDGLRVTGKRSGYTITLGDTLVVEIADVSIERRTIYGRRLSGSAADDAVPQLPGARGKGSRDAGARKHRPEEPPTRARKGDTFKRSKGEADGSRKGAPLRATGKPSKPGKAGKGAVADKVKAKSKGKPSKRTSR